MSRSALQLWTFVASSLALFMVVLDNLVVTTALPVIRVDLDASIEGLEWTVNAYTLTFAVFLLTGAALGDRFGRRRMFALGIAVFTAASVGAALAPSVEALVAFRAVQGLGGAMVMPLTLTILSAAFPAEKRGAAIGAWSGISGLAVAIGPLAGGAVVDGLSWQWIFWLNVPIGVALIPIVLRRVEESYGPYDTLDLVGLGLGSAGLFGIVYGIVQGNAHGWTSTGILLPILLGLALMIAFLRWEARSPHPMLPLRFFRNRTFSATNGVSLAMYFGMFGAIFLLAQFFQTAQGYSPLEAGLRTLPWTAMPMLVAPIAGVLSGRIGSRPLMTVGIALQAGALAWLAAISTADLPYGALVAPFVLAGVGMSLVFPAIATAILGSVRPEEEGQASGANNAIRELGGVLGIAVLASVFSSNGSYESPQAFVGGLVPAIWVAAAIVGLGVIAALAVPALRPGTRRGRARAPRAALDTA